MYLDRKELIENKKQLDTIYDIEEVWHYLDRTYPNEYPAIMVIMKSSVPDAKLDWFEQVFVYPGDFTSTDPS